MIVRRGYLYLSDLSPRFGTEAGKIRPVVVIQTDLLNMHSHPSTWVIPCTTKLSGENILRVELQQKIAGNIKACEVMIDQSRSIDNKRFIKKLGIIPKPIFNEILDKLKKLAGIY